MAHTHAVLDQPIAAYDGKRARPLLKEAIDAPRELIRRSDTKGRSGGRCISVHPVRAAVIH
ncbi:hypothetical protein MTBSS4_120066 [Magnetospirillum sp. SS-4]|nr:hypothetical protein MTBSS4_120066 [Magnetospirillum sp. SS-4]